MAFVNHAALRFGSGSAVAALSSSTCIIQTRVVSVGPNRRVRHATPCVPTMCTPSADSESPEPRKVPFEIRGFSLANVGLALGLSITLFSFSEYFSTVGAASVSSLGFVYGLPILLIGCALKYAELEPVEVASSEGAKEARETKGTEIQKKIYSDITRHRYGDEAHLSAALASLGLIPRGEPCPELLRGRDQAVDGEYSITLEFYSVATPFKEWSSKIEKFERFFGPGVTVKVEKIDAEQRIVGLTITSSTGAGDGASVEAEAIKVE